MFIIFLGCLLCMFCRFNMFEFLFLLVNIFGALQMFYFLLVYLLCKRLQQFEIIFISSDNLCWNRRSQLPSIRILWIAAPPHQVLVTFPFHYGVFSFTLGF